ncbi:MAG: hypothetical protein DMG00_12020 [Acidobacteria bacterium]|nr:MAG: hypothetical protein DMG00_12020 [Acidobacteriota bacterium]
MGAQRHRPRTARHGLHVAVCRVRPSARPAVGQQAASGHPVGGRVRLERADGSVGPRAQFRSAHRRAPRRRRRRSDLLARLDVAHRRSLPDDLARAREVVGKRSPMSDVEAGEQVASPTPTPRRGTKEEHEVGDRRREGNPFLLVLSIPTMWWIIASGALHNFNMYALGSFVAPFLVRFHKINFLDAGWVAAAVYGFSGTIGLVVGGALADRLYRYRVDGRLIVGCGSIVLCAPLMYLGLTRPSGDVWGFALLMGAGCGVMYAYYSVVYSTIHDVVEPALRGTAMALYFCAMYLLGASLGPVGTGLVSDYFTFQRATVAGTVQPLGFGALIAAELRSLLGESKGFDVRALEPFRAEGLHTAMFVVPILAAILAVVLFAASRTVAKDVANLRAWMQKQQVGSPK